ncbi:MAG: RluA family pseudouridine synthase [Lachnospiraceae bacterium]|nr:RluA family pseudouridine synthase [Lachnospiraceae bacterium]
MQERIADRQAEGMRLDKFLRKVLPGAPDSFLYRMLRKKNIVVNETRAEGSLLLHEGDRIRLYLSDDTIEQFRAGKEELQRGEAILQEAQTAYRTLRGLRVIEQTGDVLFLHKPAGILSQKADQKWLSANEWLIGYLLQEGRVSAASLSDFKPSVCNRLDRGTDGILIAAGTRQGAREMTRLIRERSIRKFYQMIVLGRITKPGEARSLLEKNHEQNRTRVLQADKSKDANAVTLYRPIRSFMDPTGREATLVEAELVTGRPHQLRAQFADMGHPIAGDAKYGNAGWNSALKKACGIHTQVLSCIRVEFPAFPEDSSRTLQELNERIICLQPPACFDRMQKE